jgi:hypothetical protein
LHTGSSSDENSGVVIFANQSMDQADVYAVIPGGESRRIGTVMAQHTDSLTVPSSMVARSGGINIVARIFASNKILQSGPIALTSGDVVRVEMPATELTLAVLPTP